MSLSKSEEYKEETKSDTILDNKIVLAAKEKDKKIANILMYIFSILVLLLNIVLLFGKSPLVIIVFPISLAITVILFCYINNPKIEIENFAITETNLFNKKKRLGHISEITSFSNNNSHVIVLKDNEKFFSFLIYGRDDNSCVYDYLKNNYKCSLRVMGNKFAGIILAFLGISGTILFPLRYRYSIFLLVIELAALYMAYRGIDELLKKFQIIDDQIIYKRLFVNKRINLSDLTRIEYKKIISSYRGVPIIDHIVMGFKGNSKVFKMLGFTTEEVKLLKGISKKYSIKMKRIK